MTCPPDLPPDVVVVGNIGIDSNVYLPPGFEGPTVEGTFTDNQDCIGQAGGYCSFGFARQGCRTRFIGYVGKDPLGRWIEAELAAQGVEVRLFIDPAGTSRSINLMRPDGTRNNFYDGKGHMSLEPDLEVCARALEGARLVHFHLPNWARRLLPLARAEGATIACDLQDLTTLDDPYRADFIDAADILFCSATNFEDPTVVLEALNRRNPRAQVVIGMGARGAGLGVDGRLERFGPVSAPEPIVDSNGAGDSLAIGFLVAHVLEGRPAAEAVRWGQTLARHTCSLRSVSTELLTREQLQARLRV